MKQYRLNDLYHCIPEGTILEPQEIGLNDVYKRSVVVHGSGDIFFSEEFMQDNPIHFEEINSQ